MHVVRQCTVCFKEFSQETTHGRPFQRCEDHRAKKYRDKRYVARLRRIREQELAKSAPSDFGEVRRCRYIYCLEEFVAQDPRQQFCNLDCYVKGRNRVLDDISPIANSNDESRTVLQLLRKDPQGTGET